MDTTRWASDSYAVVEVDDSIINKRGSPLVICERRNRSWQKGRVIVAFPMSDIDDGKVIVTKRTR